MVLVINIYLKHSHLLKEGRQLFVPKGDYVIKEDGAYYSYPKSLFEKHYVEKGNPYRAQCEEALARIRKFIQDYALDVKIESEWDEEMSCYFINHDTIDLENLCEGKVYESIVVMLNELFYSKGITEVAFGFDYELALRTGKMECPHSDIEILDSQNLGLMPRYDILCADCSERLKTGILRDQALDFIQQTKCCVVAGNDYLEDEEGGDDEE